MSDIGHNSGEVNEGQLRAFVERVEVLNTEIKDRNEDKSAVFGEAKSAGYDVKVLKHIIKLRSQDPDKLAEFESLVERYLSAVGAP
jgi:uncharacterized protein (UPF0335 family)